MKPVAFDYCRPENLAEALAALAEFGDDAVILSGGLSLGAMLNMRLVRPDAVIDINRITGFDSIEQTATALHTGPLVRQADALNSPQIKNAVPLLAAALPSVGHYQTRSRGTLAGSVAHADPSAEIPLCLAVLGGAVELSSSRGQRRLAAGDFLQGALTNGCEADEMVTELIWPVVPGPTGVAFIEIAERHGDFAIASAAAWVRHAGGENNFQCALGLGGVEECPRVTTGTATITSPGDLNEFARHTADDLVRLLEPMNDQRASAAYRHSIAGHLATKSLSQALINLGAGAEA